MVFLLQSQKEGKVLYSWKELQTLEIRKLSFSFGFGTHYILSIAFSLVDLSAHQNILG